MGMSSLFDTDDVEPQRSSADALARPLAAACGRDRSTSSWGKEHLLGEGSALRSAIEQGRPHSMILYGPPGSGKTTLARIVAAAAHAALEELSAVEAGRPEVRKVLERAQHRRQLAEPTVFFLDEIHRFNKAQQDALLPAVEEGLVTLIGATTENPYFEVNSALLSRCQVYELRPLLASDIEVVLRRAVETLGAEADDDAIAFLAARAGGDARTALAAFDLAVKTHGRVTLEAAEDSLQRRALTYDKTGDRHYDTISAWIKATRGSDPDASLYYLAVMLEAARIRASSCAGWSSWPPRTSATPTRARSRSPVAAAQAIEHVGLPEGQFALAQASIYLSLAPKSDSAKKAIGAAASTSASRAPSRRRPICRAPATTPRPASGAAWATTTPTTARPRVRAGAAAPTTVVGRASTRPTTPRRRCASAWRRSAAHAGGSLASPWRRAQRCTARVLQPGHRRAAGGGGGGAPARGGGRGRGGRQRAAAVGDAAPRRPGALHGPAAQAVIDEFDELTDLIVAEQGRPRAEVEVMELLAAVETLQWLAEHGPGILAGEKIPFSRTQHPVKRGRWSYEPLGVVGVLGPPTEPFATPLGDVAVALMAGNGVVLKPSPHVPAVRRADRARLRPRRAARGPAGGRPRPHRRGGRARVGPGGPGPLHGLGARRARGRRGVRARPDALGPLARGQGRDARAGRRQPAARGARRRVGGLRQRGPVRRLGRARAVRAGGPRSLPGRGRGGGARLRVGDPADPSTSIGPLVARERVARVRALVDEAVGAGATLHCGGPHGEAHYAPAVLSGVTPAMRLAREEAPGPVLAVEAVATRRRPSRAPTRRRSGSARRCGRPTATRARASPASCAWGWCG
jgi:putative ATPase